MRTECTCDFLLEGKYISKVVQILRKNTVQSLRDGNSRTAEALFCVPNCKIFPQSRFSRDTKKKRGKYRGKRGYSSVRRVVDQLEPRPWPFDDRTSTREVAAAYIAPAKFDDPLGKSNAADVAWRRLVCGTRRRFFTLTPRNTVVRPVRRFLACDRGIPDAEPVDRELPRWQQRPDFAGNRSRFVAISDTRYTSLMFWGGRRRTEWGRENSGWAGSQLEPTPFVILFALRKRGDHEH